MQKKIVRQKCSSGNTGKTEQIKIISNIQCFQSIVNIIRSKTIHRHRFLKRPLILNSGGIVLSAEVLLKIWVTLMRGLPVATCSKKINTFSHG